MEPLAPGQVVLVPFPFSDLSRAKLRPALVLADAGRGDWILAQITSNPYADPNAVSLEPNSFAHGGLQRTSFARPGRLFTASPALVVGVAGQLHTTTFNEVISRTRSLFTPLPE